MTFIRKKTLIEQVLVEDSIPDPINEPGDFADTVIDKGLDKIQSDLAGESTEEPTTDQFNIEFNNDQSQDSDDSTTDSEDKPHLLNEEEPNLETYKCSDILEVLKNYFHPDVVEEVENDWIQKYPDGLMNETDLFDIWADLKEVYNEEFANEIINKIKHPDGMEDTTPDESFKIDDDTSISDLHAKTLDDDSTDYSHNFLSVRTANFLRNSGINTVGELKDLSINDLRKLIVGNPFGNRRMFKEVLEFLAKYVH